MIDISEEIRPLSGWSKELPRRRQGRPVNTATLYRWAKQGLKGVRLEVIQIGGSTCTSKSALQRFFNALTEVASDSVDEHQEEVN